MNCPVVGSPKRPCAGRPARWPTALRTSARRRRPPTRCTATGPRSGGAQLPLQGGQDVALGDHRRLGVGPTLVLDLAFLQAALADHHAMRDADQFHVGEHYAGALIAVVQHDVDAGLLQVGIQLIGSGLDRLALVIAHRHDADFKRRDSRRQDDAALVVALLDGGADDTRDADAVAAQFHDLALAVFIEIAAAERLGVLLAQLENVADFDAAQDFQLAPAIRRRVTGDDVAQVENFRFRQVAAEIDPGQVEAGLLGSADKITHRGNAAVGKNSHFFAIDRSWTDIAGFAAEVLLNFAFGGETEGIDRRNFARLDLV